MFRLSGQQTLPEGPGKQPLLLPALIPGKKPEKKKIQTAAKRKHPGFFQALVSARKQVQSADCDREGGRLSAAADECTAVC